MASFVANSFILILCGPFNAKHPIAQVLDLKEMVVGEMLRDRSLMVSLFQKCGKAEFKFLVNRYVKAFSSPSRKARFKRRRTCRTLENESVFHGLPWVLRDTDMSMKS